MWHRIAARPECALRFTAGSDWLPRHHHQLEMGGRTWRGLISALIGMAAGGGLIWVIRLVASAASQQEAMGFGDVTLMAMIGAVFGWQPVLIAFFARSHLQWERWPKWEHCMCLNYMVRSHCSHCSHLYARTYRKQHRIGKFENEVGTRNSGNRVRGVQSQLRIRHAAHSRAHPDTTDRYHNAKAMRGVRAEGPEGYSIFPC